jgi:hypothetical protein
MPRYREILSYTEMTGREGLSLQKGMNFRTSIKGGAAGYSIILMSVRKNAPYQDQWHEPGSPEAIRHGAGDRGVLEYEGHDLPKRQGATLDPKRVDQPLTLPGSGKPTDNGKLYNAAMAYQADPAGTAPDIVQMQLAAKRVVLAGFRLADELNATIGVAADRGPFKPH